jgi:heme/copper-type cytochrome/quinol oxidase subunit 1
MALTDTEPETEAAPPEVDDAPSSASEPSSLELVLGSGDHAVVGRVLVIGSLLMLSLGLVGAALVLISQAGNGALPDSLVTRLGPNHLIGLALCGVLPLFLGIAMVVVPRQVGAGSIAFPRAAAASAWTWLISSVIFVVAVVGNGSYGGANREFSRMGNVATGAIMVSLILASICVAATVLTCRPMGLRLGDVPFFSFSMLVAATIWTFTLPSAVAHITLGHLTHATPPTLLVKTYGQGIEWLFHQPAAYALCIPVLGIALDVVAHLTGGRHRFRGVILTSIGLYGLLSFGAWAQTAVQRATSVWVLSSLLIVLPVLVVFVSLGDTARAGRFTLASPLGFAVLSLFVLLLALLVGAFMAINTTGHGDLGDFDLVQVNLGQLYMLVGAAVLGGLGGCVYWSQLVFSGPMSEGAARAIAPVALVGGVLFGGALFIVGVATPGDSAVRAFAGVAAAGGLILLLAVLGILGAGVAELVRSRRGDELLPDPWGGAGTLEWAPVGTYASVDGPYPLLEQEGAA